MFFENQPLDRDATQRMIDQIVTVCCSLASFQPLPNDSAYPHFSQLFWSLFLPREFFSISPCASEIFQDK